MKRMLLVLLAVALAVFVATPASAQSTANLSVAAQVNARASLSLSTNSISFADADPDTTPSISASSAVTVTAKSRTSGGNAVTLTVQSGGNLTSGGDSITISNVTWTATADLSAGTMDTSAVTIGSWSGSGNRGGDMSYKLANSWTYATGNYTATVTYTLSAP